MPCICWEMLASILKLRRENKSTQVFPSFGQGVTAAEKFIPKYFAKIHSFMHNGEKYLTEMPYMCFMATTASRG